MSDRSVRGIQHSDLNKKWYLRQVWVKNDWLYEGQHGFRRRYSCESQVITECQNIADHLDEGIDLHAIIIDFSKAFDLVPHDRLLIKLAA